MTILDRYLLRTILSATLLSAFAVTAIAGVMVVIQELERLSHGGYGVPYALILVLLEMPQWIYDLFPVMVLLGALMGLGMLAAGSELVVMRASGISLGRLSRSAAIAGLLLASICFAVGEWLAPLTLAKADSLRIQPESRGKLAMTADGAWLRDGNTFVKIGRIAGNRRIEDVRLFHVNRKRELDIMLVADAAEYREGNWVLLDVRRSVLSDKAAVGERFQSLVWKTSLQPDLLSVSRLQPDRLSIAALFEYATFLRDNDLDSLAYELAFWRKVAAPVTVLLMVLLSVPFSIGPLRSTGAGQRLFVGALVGVGYFLVNMIAASTGQVYRFNPLLAAWLPTAVLALATWVWLRKLNSPVQS